MTYRAVLLATFFTAVYPVYAQPPTVHDELELAVRQYLSVKYDEFEDLGPERRRIYGVSYNPAAPLKKLDILELAETLSDTQFLTTTLDTPHWCYPRLEVFVAATKTDAGFLIRSTVSPVYTEPSRKLLAIVRGKMARTDDNRKRLAIGVGKMLSAVTYDGQLKNVKANDIWSLPISEPPLNGRTFGPNIIVFSIPRPAAWARQTQGLWPEEPVTAQL